MKKLLWLVGPSIVALGVGCASSQPPRELVDARAAYANAQRSPGAQYVVQDMRDAQLALDGAEKRFAEDGDEASTRDAAYIAQRRAIAATAKGEAFANMNQKRQLEASLEQYRQQRLGQMKSELAAAQKSMESERSARVQAEQKANEALATINGLKAQQDARGTVLTLSGSVLFKTGSSELLPQAKQRLGEVATALKEDKRNITVYGFTDSTGSDEKNQKLSEQRAAAVRKYLTEQGVPGDRIKSEGMGEANPIADNATAEGRANNRRVEIVLQSTQNPGDQGQKPGTSEGGAKQGGQGTPTPKQGGATP